MISPINDILIGNDAGWLLSFSKEGSTAEPFEIGRDDYHGEIEATLPSGLEGGNYKFTIEGITDADYAKLAQGKTESPDTVKLYLYWRDVGSSVGGFMKNLVGLTDSFSKVTGSDLIDNLVAVLSISSVSRKAGERRYEATIQAREKVFQQLSTGRLCSPLEAPNPLQAAQDLAEEKGVEVVAHPFIPAPREAESGENPGDERQELRQGQKNHEALNELGRRMEEASSNHYGRGMYLIRNGVLHIGARPIPLPLQTPPKDLMLSNGLIQIESAATLVMDRNFDYCQVGPNGTSQQPRKRKQYKLTLKGRPDLKPGDVVKFDVPVEEDEKANGSWNWVVGDLFGGPIVPDLGHLSSGAKLMYVSSAVHKLGRKSSFVTTITGVVMDSLTDGWDTHTRRSEEEDERCEQCIDGTIEGRVANAVNRRVTSAIHSRKFHEVGEVRTFNHEGSDEPPSQTETVWRGLAPADGRRNRARRLAITRPTPSPASGVAYTSPFAFGKCGLVLPRYPGTRVLIAHRQGREDDPIDVGAIWESGHGPDSEAGDYWLILPVDFPAAERSTLAETATPHEHTGKVSQDLIDASGNRIIEVGSLTIRVGAGALKDAGIRPDSGSEDNLDGTQIVVNADGSVLIKTANKNIELDAGSGDIKLKANNVKVEVQGTMDVS